MTIIITTVFLWIVCDTVFVSEEVHDKKWSEVLRVFELKSGIKVV